MTWHYFTGFLLMLLGGCLGWAACRIRILRHIDKMPFEPVKPRNELDVICQHIGFLRALRRIANLL